MNYPPVKSEFPLQRTCTYNNEMAAKVFSAFSLQSGELLFRLEDVVPI